MKKIILATAFFITVNSFCFSQEMETENKIIIPKHEIGFTVGAFPLISIDHPEDRFIFAETMPKYKSYREFGDGQYEKKYHFGSYALNYNYHFNSKHSAGVSLSWQGIHIDRYRIYYGGWGDYSVDTVDGSGWSHYFTLQGNWRRTYYQKNAISLYCGVNLGVLYCKRDKNLLPQKTKHRFFNTTSSDRYFFDMEGHINAFGIDIGTKHILNMELGIGSLGILRAGYKYRFDIVPVVNLQE